MFVPVSSPSGDKGEAMDEIPRKPRGAWEEKFLNTAFSVDLVPEGTFIQEGSIYKIDSFRSLNISTTGSSA